ncbi:hypothetical protein C8Q74DRAFT_1221128 [Fomes fomentarius]|nr:hypothetical protein C8Q74DRAFT_1221128 [Fomes fomentarius]
MRVLPILPSLIASLYTSAHVAGAALTPAPPPTFETLFVGQFTAGDVRVINNGTFGTRLHAPIIGGNLSDTSGKLVANILPAADTGLVSNSGIFFPEAVIPLVWTADNKSAYLQILGVGKLFVADALYIHLETDSEAYNALNSRFLVGNLTFSQEDPQNPTLTIFGLV